MRRVGARLIMNRRHTWIIQSTAAAAVGLSGCSLAWTTQSKGWFGNNNIMGAIISIVGRSCLCIEITRLMFLLNNLLLLCLLLLQFLLLLAALAEETAASHD